MRNVSARALLLILMLMTYRGIEPSAQVRQSATRSSLSSGESEQIKRFERQLEELRLRLKIPGMSAAIIKNQQLIWAKGFGFSDYENKIAATAETPYELASVTKPIAATLLMQLVEQGRVSLDDPMSKYSSEYKDDSIKVRHVLTHTSEGTPGEHYSYNGDLFDNLTDVIMKASGKRFRLLLSENILLKLGATDSTPANDFDAHNENMATMLGADNEEHYIEVLKRLAKPYRLYGADEIVRTFNPRKGIGAATGMVSTVTDLAKFDIAIDRNLLVKKSSQEKMWTPTVSNGGQTLPYGLGWFVQQYHGLKLVWHNGYLPDLYSALYLKVPEKGITFILLANSGALSAPFHLAQGNVMESAFACLFIRSFVLTSSDCEAASQSSMLRWVDERRKAVHPQIKLTSQSMESYVGQYQLDSGNTLTITLEGGRLMRQGKVLKVEMFPESETKFFTKAMDGEYVFVKNAQGQAIQLKILQGGEEATAKKIN